MSTLSGRIALVTGAGRGIGREIALRLARDGALVAVHYGSNRDGAAGVLAEIEGSGGQGFLAGADLSQRGAVEQLFAILDAELADRGHTGLDILVNNAGITMQRDLDSLTPEEFDRVIAVNLKAPLFVAQQAARRMEAGGRIINISSMVASRAYSGGAIAYGASKAAIDYVTLAMAASLGPRGITVNAVAPGTTATELIKGVLVDERRAEALKQQTALRAIADPIDVANVVAFLASPESRFVTGESIRAGGGTLL